MLLRIALLLSCIAPSAFAVDAQTRVIGGNTADVSYPWVVSVGSITTKDGKQVVSHFCGGTLISADWVLTAAHCVDSDSDDTSAQLQSAFELAIGATDISLANENGVEHKRIKRIVVHPEYQIRENRNGNYGYDVALLELTTASSHTPVGRATPLEQSGLNSSSALRLIGWGDTDKSSEVVSPKELQYADLFFVPQDTQGTCDDYGNRADFDFDVMFCAGVSDSTKDACQGDSGGPLFDAANDVQYGIVSWGYGCATTTFGVYSKVSAYTDFIDAVIEGVYITGSPFIGFVGEGKNKSTILTLVNNSGAAAAATLSTDVSGFSVSSDCNKTLSISETCDFIVTANAPAAGIVNLPVYLNSIERYEVNAKVLESISSAGAAATNNELNWYSIDSMAHDSSLSGWAVATDGGSEDGSSLKSKSTASGGRAALLTYIEGPAVFHYWSKVSSESGADFFRVLMDETGITDNTAVSGEQDWTHHSFNVADGEHHILFLYTKDDAGKSGSDAVWLDKVSVCALSDSSCNAEAKTYSAVVDSKTTVKHKKGGSLYFVLLLALPLLWRARRA